MKIDEVLNILFAKDTGTWSQRIDTDYEDKKIDVHFYINKETGLPTISLLYSDLNIITKIDYFVHFKHTLYKELLKNLQDGIKFLIAIGTSCSSKKTLEEHDKEMKIYQEEMMKAQMQAQQKQVAS